MPYTFHHGGDIYTYPGVLDFSVNINPLGMPQEAKEAAVRSIGDVGRYPDWKCRNLTKALLKYYKTRGISLREEQIIWGNGASELIYALCEMLMLNKKRLSAYIPAPTFSVYEEAVLAVGGTLTKDPEQADVIFICNPNNPTGTFREKDALLHFVNLCRDNGSVLCIDESFLPFTDRPETQSAVCFQSPNVLVLRSLTKIYAMPGLRLGYLVIPELSDGTNLRSLLQPWNLSIPAQAAGEAALKNDKFTEQTRIYIRKEKDFLLSQLPRDLVRISFKSEANFILFESDADLWERMIRKGIMIRRCSDIRGLAERHFRIGIRTHEENQYLVEKMKELRCLN